MNDPAKQRPATIALTDELHQDEPSAYLVLCPDSCATHDYEVFINLGDARFAAENHEESEGRDWMIYPLYATHPITRRDK